MLGDLQRCEFGAIARRLTSRLARWPISPQQVECLLGAARRANPSWVGSVGSVGVAASRQPVNGSASCCESGRRGLLRQPG